MAEPPEEAEARGGTRRALARAGHQRRDGGEVVGVGRVAEAEDDRDDGDERQLAAVGERCDPAVESEHGQLTFGTACTVIARPAARMTRALAAGSSRISGPSKLRRRNARRGEHRDEADAGDAEREAGLKARIRSRPKATRCSEIAASRTTSAEGHGSSPPETPTASSERKLGPSGSAAACVWSWW